jgi:hypothetical protein
VSVCVYLAEEALAGRWNAQSGENIPYPPSGSCSGRCCLVGKVKQAEDGQLTRVAAAAAVTFGQAREIESDTSSCFPQLISGELVVLVTITSRRSK